MSAFSILQEPVLPEVRATILTPTPSFALLFWFNQFFNDQAAYWIDHPGGSLYVSDVRSVGS